MGERRISQADETRPLTRVKGMESQSSQCMALMAGLVTLLLMNLLDFGEEGAHLELKPQHWSILELWCDWNGLTVARATAWHLQIPRE